MDPERVRDEVMRAVRQVESECGEQIALESIEFAVRDRFRAHIAEANVKAARAAYEAVGMMSHA